MKKLIVVFAIFAIAPALWAQTGSEILLFNMKMKKGKVILSNPKNVTNHVGYDNQPSFHNEKPFLYYASFNDEGRSDIKSYDFKTEKTINITTTSEREYSPTLTPDQGYLSCIIQRDNNAQDLGKYPVDGGEPTVLVDNLTVGYHVWADNSHLALFVLGTPMTLHYLTLPTKEDTIIAENIGRSLHRVPNERAISFVHKVEEKKWLIKKLDTETMKVTILGETLPGREDITWTPGGTLLSSDGSKLFYWKDNKWSEITIENPPAALKGITRLAVNGDGTKLAVVVSE